MRIVLTILALVLLPTAGFFLWAWCRIIVRERRLAGTLPAWQTLPWTWLIIAGLVIAIVSILYLVLLTKRPDHGYFGPRSDFDQVRTAQISTV